MTLEEEKAWDMINASFGELEKVMGGRGYKAPDFRDRYLDAALRWIELPEDREGAKVVAAHTVRNFVDGLFDEMGDGPVPIRHAEFDDPQFSLKAHRLTVAEQQAYDAWLAKDEWTALIDRALVAGRQAYTERLTTPDDPQRQIYTYAVIEFGGPRWDRHKPLIGALQRRGIGSIDEAVLSFDISIDDLIKRSTDHAMARHAAVEAFARELSKPGFELRIVTEDL